MSSYVKTLLMLERDCWRIVHNADELSISSIEFKDSGDPLSVLEELADEFEKIGYSGSEVCLGLGSCYIQAVEIDCDDLPRRQRTEMMLYRMEEQLPLPAEELTAVYLPSLGGRCLGLAVETKQIREIIEGLQSVGISLGAVCPSALLSLWACLEDCETQPNYVLLANSDQLELFRISGGAPHSWYSFLENSNLLHSLRINLLDHPVPSQGATILVAGDLPQKTLDALGNELEVIKKDGDENFYERAAARTGESLSSGKQAGWVNFRTGKLAPAKQWSNTPGLLRTAAVLAVIFVIAVVGAFITRGLRYDSLASNYRQDQREIYRKLYPHSKKIPANITSRLESELRRFSGVKGQGQDVPPLPQALDDLHTALTNLPPKIRFRILKLQVNPDDIFIEGEVKTHSDAEAIVQSLKKAGLDVLPPKTERIASGDVAFKITAHPSLLKDQLAARGGVK